MADPQTAKTNKDEVIRFRLTEAEAEAFRSFCAGQRLSVSEALRRMAKAAAGFGPTFTGEGRTEVVELTRQLRAVGINLNQAVHHMNAGHAFPADELHGWLGDALRVIHGLDFLYSSLTGRARSRAAAAIEQPNP
jgi:hypothetical protein